MKKLLLSLVILPIFCLAQSPSKKDDAIFIKAQCYKTEIISKQLLASKEQPILMGRIGDTANSIMSLWTNVKTGAWTLVLSKGNGDMSCVLGNGYDLKLLDLGEVI